MNEEDLFAVAAKIPMKDVQHLRQITGKLPANYILKSKTHKLKNSLNSLMKEINKEKFKEMLRKVRIRFGMTYYGASNNMNLGIKVNDKEMTPQMMTDEQLVLLWQLMHGIEDILAREQIKRDLLPDDIKQMFVSEPPQPTSPIINDNYMNN